MDPLTLGAGALTVAAVAGASQMAESLGSRFSSRNGSPSLITRHDRDSQTLGALNGRKSALR